MILVQPPSSGSDSLVAEQFRDALSYDVQESSTLGESPLPDLLLKVGRDHRGPMLVYRRILGLEPTDRLIQFVDEYLVISRAPNGILRPKPVGRIIDSRAWIAHRVQHRIKLVRQHRSENEWI
jgi:hypothetical protein